MNPIQIFLNIPKFLGKTAIKFYQFFFSFDHSFWAKYSTTRVCIHEPSCSQYTYEAIDKHGLIKGSIMGGARISRCNPMAKGGYDPVPEFFTLKRNEAAESTV